MEREATQANQAKSLLTSAVTSGLETPEVRVNPAIQEALSELKHINELSVALNTRRVTESNCVLWTIKSAQLTIKVDVDKAFAE